MAAFAKPSRQSRAKRSQRRGGPSKPCRPLSVQPLERRLPLDASGVSPTSMFVATAFQQVLVREVDQASLTFFSTSLQGGAMTRLAFTETLTHSVEYYSSVITDDYTQFLGRAPDATGLAFWNGLMQQGMTDEQLEAQFIGTPEFFDHAGGTNRDWVDRMYFDLLGRSPDSPGEVAWVNFLDAGMPRSLAAFGFASSAEREAIIIRNDYQLFLGRQASDGEVAGWVNRFRDGMYNEDIIAGFVASDESFNNDEHQSGLNGVGPGDLGSANPGSVNIGSININIGSININSGNINSGNVNSGNINSGNVGSAGPGAVDDGHPRPHGDD